MNQSFRQLVSFFSILLFVGIFFISCQKELAHGDNAIGILKVEPNTFICEQSEVIGKFKSDSTLGKDNALYVLIDVRSAGRYRITTDTINGYYFNSIGEFGNTGLNLVRLNGYGKPGQPGINTFKVSFEGTYCYVDVLVQGNNPSADASYTFGGNQSTCTGAMLNGTNQQGLAFGIENIVKLNVTVITPGAYNISTQPAVNGVVYKATGFFTGNETTVTLTGSGTPIASGNFNFTVTGNGTSCTFPVVFEPPPGPAVFTLGGAPGECTNSRTGGIYTKGIPVNATHTDTINVKVTTTGSYSITTDTKNGISFTSSGVFTNIGVQDVVLYAQGTPIENGNFTYTVTASGSSCTFDVSTDYIICKIDGAVSTFNSNASWGVGNLTGLSIDGKNNINNNFPSIGLRIFKNNNNYTPATYTTIPVMNQTTVSCDYNDPAGMNYYAATGLPLPFTIIITKISDKRVEGTFFGTVKDNNGNGANSKEVTEGAFSVPRL
ncbi:MAG: hypothetical protein FGM46_04285 [Ferruginibacter sp.]|nr:hypothetical protein [Ferruginibacter sp.]